MFREVACIVISIHTQRYVEVEVSLLNMVIDICTRNIASTYVDYLQVEYHTRLTSMWLLPKGNDTRFSLVSTF